MDFPSERRETDSRFSTAPVLQDAAQPLRKRRTLKGLVTEGFSDYVILRMVVAFVLFLRVCVKRSPAPLALRGSLKLEAHIKVVYSSHTQRMTLFGAEARRAP